MDDLDRLKPSDEIWEGTVRLARTWIRPPHQAPYRPWLVVWADPRGRVPATQVFDALPTVDETWKVLVRAMRQPQPGAGRPRRPKTVYFDVAEHAQAFAPRLAALGVSCEYRPRLAALEAALAGVERKLNRGQTPLPGLLSISGVTPPLLGHLYTEATRFFEATPWRVLNDRHPIELRCPPEAPPRYAVVMGSGGEVYGLAVYDTLADLRRMYANKSERDLTDVVSWFVLFYEEAIAMAFDDLDAIARYGWPVPGVAAYPVMGRTRPGSHIDLPTRRDLLWLAGALPACLDYYQHHLRLRHGQVAPAELALTVSILGSPASVHLWLPALLSGETGKA